MFSWLLKPFAPYVVAVLLGLLASAGLAVWYLQVHAETLSASLATTTESLKQANERLSDASKTITKQQEDADKAKRTYDESIRMLQADVALRDEQRAKVAIDLNEANAVINKLMRNGDDDTKRFLGPLPPSIVDFLRYGTGNLPASSGNHPNGVHVSARTPDAGYPGAIAGSD